MVRSKQKPKHVVRLTCGAAHTDVARYEAREDRHFVVESSRGAGAGAVCDDFAVDAESELFACVLDGHRGAVAAETARAHLPGALRAGIDGQRAPVADAEATSALVRAFLATEAAVVAAAPEGGGACCVAAVVRARRLHVAWLGDCRALAATAAGGVERLTRDHTPDRERERIAAAGGFVHEVRGVWRVGVLPPTTDGPAPKKRKIDMLAACRAFGDADFGPVVAASPDVVHVDLAPDLEFVLLQSDGVHEALADDLAAGAVRAALADGGDAAAAARAVVDAAKAAGSTDDITAVVLRCHVA